MKYGLSALLVVALVCVSSVAMAADAATSELPAALSAIGAADSIVSVEEAKEVRGTYLVQTKDFSITGGTAVGTTTLMEGILGNFEFTQVTDGSTFKAEGAFGGLAGNVGISLDCADFGQLTFAFEGKALSEKFDFTGNFSQNFSQYYKP